MKIGVLGAGWLGKCLVEVFRERGDAEVRYTNRVKVNDEVGGFAFAFGQSIPTDFLDGLDFLFISSTLPKNQGDTILEFVYSLNDIIPVNCIVVFTSTIGVYQDNNEVVNEDASLLNHDSIYLKMEQLLFNHFQERTIILRLGGLIGEDRHPITALAGRKGIADGQKGVNLVHRGDILKFCQLIVERAVSPGIYNLVYPSHPEKKIYYTQKAFERQLDPPTFLIGTNSGKKVDSFKSQAVSGFKYSFPI